MGALRHERWCRAHVAAAALAPPPPCRGRRAPEPTPPDTRPGWGAPEPGAGGGGTLADLLELAPDAQEASARTGGTLAALASTAGTRSPQSRTKARNA